LASGGHGAIDSYRAHHIAHIGRLAAEIMNIYAIARNSSNNSCVPLMIASSTSPGTSRLLRSMVDENSRLSWIPVQSRSSRFHHHGILRDAFPDEISPVSSSTGRQYTFGAGAVGMHGVTSRHRRKDNRIEFTKAWG